MIDEDEPPVIEYVCKPEGCVEPLCRMPQLLTETTTSRRSNRTKTRLLNLPEIALSINRPESHLLAFLALHNNATAGADRHGTFFIGSFSSRLLQASVMEFLEKYVVCGVTGSPSTIIATVVGRNGERKLRLKGPTSEGNLSAKKCGHSYAGMLDVVARDPMPEAEQMAVRWLWSVVSVWLKIIQSTPNLKSGAAGALLRTRHDASQPGHPPDALPTGHYQERCSPARHTLLGQPCGQRDPCAGGCRPGRTTSTPMHMKTHRRRWGVDVRMLCARWASRRKPPRRSANSPMPPNRRWKKPPSRRVARIPRAA